MALSKKSILMILVEPPLPFGNAASRWFHVLLKELDRRGHRVDVLVVSSVANDIEKAKKIFSGRKNFFIFPFGKNKGLRGKLQTFLYPHRYMFTPDFYKKLAELDPKNYDILHIEQTWAGWMGFPYKHKALINVHHLQSIDLEFVQPKSLKEKWLYQSWFSAEKKILTQYPFVRICSPRLKSWIEPWGTKKLIATVPVSLDLALYPFIPKEKRRHDQFTITVIGNMTWYPSISAAERLLKNLWPEISRQVPKARLRVVGWSARTALKDYLALPKVEILENVPDIQPYFEEASVMVYAPARGSGMKIKILESLAFGIPVVTTSEGAEGLPAIDMEHLGLCEDDQGLIDRTVKILKNPDLQERLRHAGRQLLSDHCGEIKTVDQIEALYEKILTSDAHTVGRTLQE